MMKTINAMAGNFSGYFLHYHQGSKEHTATDVAGSLYLDQDKYQDVRCVS